MIVRIEGKEFEKKIFISKDLILSKEARGSLMVQKTCNLQTWRDFIEGPLGSNQPNISHLRVFGSMCFRHVPEQVRKKLDDQSKSRECS